jgi:hypothetical protein
MRVAAIFEMMWHYALGDRGVCGPMAMMQTKGAARNSPSDSRHEPGQSAVGAPRVVAEECPPALRRGSPVLAIYLAIEVWPNFDAEFEEFSMDPSAV